MPGLIAIVWNNKVDEPLLDEMVNSKGTNSRIKRIGTWFLPADYWSECC